MTEVDGGARFPTAQDLLLTIVRCPIMEAHLEGRREDSACREVVLHQWANVPSEESRKRRWRRERHAPVPWAGQLDRAPILFISSNPNLTPADLRKPEEAPIPDPIPLEMEGKSVGNHPSLLKPFRAPKASWAADEITDAYENNFEVWVKDDGVTPLSATGRRRAKVPYWEFARAQAEQLICDRPVRPGWDYALTEVVHCKSAKERGVDKALATCASRYLAAVLAASPARVVIATGAKAAKAIELVYGLPRQNPGSLVGPTEIAGRERQLLYLPHPGWLRRNPERTEALTLPKAVTIGQLKSLRTAVQ